ncbi:regulator of G-protein signaling 12-like [Anneissia japonica]|uniref:regulator of G-protein signaling 12-like n=1 Tax=Anneissia japonica TaxID=1529436 RepID=UPI0014256450|nr:regulator of G-protein signaling 12-like [Anneissia japonica]
MHSSRKKGKMPLMKKTVEVGRAQNGYGFTLAGQAPCFLSCILSGSPSEQANLKPGDRVLAINGKNVSRMSHEQVVKLIGSAVDVLRITVAEQEPCESSDDEYNPRPRSRYSNARPKSTPPVGINQHESAVDSFIQGKYTNSGFNGGPQLYGPGKIPSNQMISAEQARLAPGHLSPFNKSGRAEILLRKSSTQREDTNNWSGKASARNNVPPKVRRSKRNSEGRTKSNSLHYQKSYDQESYDVKNDAMAQRSMTPVQLSNILYPSLQPHPASQGRQSAPPSGQASMRVVVGYLGSIDIPASANLPTASLQAIRGCVRRLRVEQRIHSAVLMEISESGVRLVNKARRTMVVYPADCVAFSGVCPDDKRFFGIVTAQNVYDAFDGNSDDEDDPVGSSCHVFLANPEISPHSVHAKLALEFGINCTLDPHYNGCIEFPHSSKPILRAISMLYSDRNNGIYQAADSPFYRGRHSNSNSSTSDSGIGYGKDSTEVNGVSVANNNNAVPILDVASHIRAKRNAEINSHSTSHSHNSNHNVHVVRAEINSSSDFPYSISSSASPASIETSPQNNLTSRLTPRARPNPVGFGNPGMQGGKQAGLGGTPLSAGSLQQLHQIMQQRQQKQLEDDEDGDVDDESEDEDFLRSQGQQVHGLPPLPHGRHSMYAKLDNTGNNKPNTGNLQRQDQNRFSDGSDTWSVRRASRPKRLIRKNEPGCQESMAASDSEVPNGEPRLRTNSLSSATSSLSIHGRSRECARRVSGWAVSFDRLLADELGVVCFTEFLKKEFSEENILFWIACEKFSKLTNRSKIKKKAQEIYNTFLTESAIHPVNLDGTVKQMVENNLSSPTSHTYQYAQQQIFHLMKYDSYARFLKCDLYKECIMAEMEGRPLPIQVSDSNGNDQVTGKGKDRIPTSLSSNVSLSDESTINSHSDSKKWKKSILPWNRRTRKTSSSKDNLSRQNSASSEDARNSGDFGQVFCHDNKLEVPKQTAKLQQSKHYMRVMIPNDSCTRVLIRRGYTMRSAIASICEQRHIPMAAMEVFFADTKEVVDLEQDMANIGPREVVIEKRVLFKIELPNKRVIGVKSKPTKKLYEVLKPITHKYQLILDAMVVHLMGSPVPLDMDMVVESLDNKRILIETVEQYSSGTYKMNGATSAVPPPVNTKLHKSLSAESVLTHGSAKYMNQRKQNGNAHKATSEKVQKQPKDVNSTLGRRIKSPLKKISNKSKDNLNPKDADDLIAAVSKAQGSRLNDQRGLTILNLELPDFLKKSSPSAGVNPPENRPRTSMGITNIYQLPEFLQNDEDNPRDTKTPKNRNRNQYFRSKSTPPIPQNYQTPTTFPDGILPTHHQAEEIFGSRNTNMSSPHFNDSIVKNSFRETNWTLDTSSHVHKLPGKRSLGYARSRSEQLLHKSGLNSRSYSQNSLRNEDLNGNDGKPLTRGNSLHYQEDPESDGEEEEGDYYQDPNSNNSSVLPPPPVLDGNTTLDIDMPNFSPPTPISYPSPPVYRKAQSSKGSTLPGSDQHPVPITDRRNDVDEDLGALPPSPSTHDLILSVDQEDFNQVMSQSKESKSTPPEEPSQCNASGINQKLASKPDVTLSAINVLEKQDKRSRMGISFPSGTTLQTPVKSENPSPTKPSPTDKRFVISKDGRRLRATFV